MNEIDPETKLRVAIELRTLFAGYHVKQLLVGSKGRLTEREQKIFELGFTKGVEYMDVRESLGKEKVDELDRKGDNSKTR